MRSRDEGQKKTTMRQRPQELQMTQDRDRRHMDRGMTERERWAGRCTDGEKRTEPERKRDTDHDSDSKREQMRSV